MNRINRIFVFLLATFFSSDLIAQQVEMADTMRSNGKIYVIVAIILIILVGLIGYLILLDRKITRLEKELKNKES